MSDSAFNLALETSSATSSLALGHGAELLTAREMPRRRRHNIDLMPTLAALCQELALQPADLEEIYVSIGPGSFTGLRVGIATAKMLALSTGAKLVAVPTLTVLARAVPEQYEYVAVALNLKRETVWSAVFDARRRAIAPPALRTLDDLLAAAPPGAVLLGDPLPQPPADAQVLPAKLAVPDARQVYAVGHAIARENRWADPATIAPLYAREPEAVTLWNQRHA
jgi:tRNA threonylcarbamoyladenosine biosynthesis protein TsaB